MEKRTLLQKYEIPVSHLDFDYVKKCKDSKELERIVAILRSGEEGYYPDLMKCAEEKLSELKPNSRVLRTEERILTKGSLSRQEWEQHTAPITEWSTEIKNKDTILSSMEEDSEKHLEIELPPVRKGGRVTSKKEQKTNPSTTPSDDSRPTRLASTDYSQWDRYDADAELLKMDLREERVKEHVERMNRINQEKSATDSEKNDERINAYAQLTPIEKEKLSEEFALKSISTGKRSRSCAQLKLRSGKQKSYKILGNEYYKVKEYTSALENYTRCIQVKPTPVGYNNRAITNIKLMRYASAVSDCDECLRLEPTNLKALLRKAEALLKLDRKLDAFQIYEQVILIEPANSIAAKALANLRSELAEVAPSHATRIAISNVDEPKQSSTQTAKPVEDYDLVELIRPNKLVKSKLAKTMEGLAKLPPSKGAKAKPSNENGKKADFRSDASSEIKLSISEPAKRAQGEKCLIQEL